MHYVVWAVFDFLSFFVQSVTELEFLRPSRIVDLVTLSTVHILSLFSQHVGLLLRSSCSSCCFVLLCRMD